MTPRVGVKTTLTNGNAPLGALVPKQGPHFFVCPSVKKVGTANRVRLKTTYRQRPGALVDPLGRGNVQVMQHVYYFGVSQPRSVILKR
jgi:hypothetical protein